MAVVTVAAVVAVAVVAVAVVVAEILVVLPSDALDLHWPDQLTHNS
jgi:hypothetical protein